VDYPTFLVCNVADGALWGTGFAVLGYVAGASYHRVEQIAARAGLVLLGLIVAGLIASRLLRHFFAARVRVRCPCLARIFGPAGDSRTDHDDVDHAERQGVTSPPNSRCESPHFGKEIPTVPGTFSDQPGRTPGQTTGEPGGSGPDPNCEGDRES